jgi:hypothetical protein
MAKSDGPRAGRMRNRRWRLGASPPSRIELRLTALAVVYVLVEISLPGEMWPLVSMLLGLAAGALLLLLGANWLLRLIITAIDDLRHLRTQGWRWLVQPAMVLILIFSFAYDLPLMARLRLSEAALIREIESTEETSRIERYVGLVWVEDVERSDLWRYLSPDDDGHRPVFVGTGGFWLTSCGLLYAPGATQLESHGDLRVAPLYGPWWRYSLSL